MSEYLTYTLWRQREERMPHELEHQRVVQERLSEQLTVPAEVEVADVPQPAGVLSTDEYVLVDE